MCCVLNNPHPPALVLITRFNYPALLLSPAFLISRPRDIKLARFALTVIEYFVLSHHCCPLLFAGERAVSVFIDKRNLRPAPPRGFIVLVTFWFWKLMQMYLLFWSFRLSTLVVVFGDKFGIVYLCNRKKAYFILNILHLLIVIHSKEDLVEAFQSGL